MKPLSLGLMLALLGGALGCSTSSPRQRQEHADAYQTNLLAETTAILQNHPRPLTLQDCMQLAWARSLQLTSARLAERLARIDSQAAFSVFLPQVGYEFEALRFSEPVEKMISDGAIEMQDQNIQRNTLTIVQPIFTPNAWLLYASARRGANMRTLARARTEQLLDLNIAGLFYQYTAITQHLAAARRQAAAANALLKESSALAREGYLLEADLQKARTLQMNQRRQVDALQRNLELARTRLLQAMDLWPLAPAAFDPASLLDTITAGDKMRVEQRPLEEWVYQALLNRLELAASDQNIALRKNEILRALALFIPNVYGFANYYTTSDSYTVNDQYWGTGIQGTLSLFTGFRDIQAYRAARAQYQQAFVDREETSMSVMLQVIEAHKNLRDIRQQLVIARQQAKTAALEYASARARYAEGQEAFSSCLQALAAQAAAEAGLENSRAAYALALFVFRDVTGLNKDANDAKQ